MANSLAAELHAKPVHYAPSGEEQALTRFIEQNADFMTPPFSIRLQAAVERLSNVHEYRDGDEQRARVSESLHQRILSQLHPILSRVLASRARVAILMDNLDKAWGNKNDIADLSALLFGLLEVAPRLVTDLRDERGHHEVNFSLTVFLRSDIFTYVRGVAREPDKLTAAQITWADPQVLVRLVDERLAASVDGALTPDEIWEQFFMPTVGGVPTKTFLTANTLPRPRDIIYLVRAALSEAVNRAHERVREEDFQSALRAYSQFAFDSLVVETNPDMRLEAVLYEFIGSSATLTRKEVQKHIAAVGVPQSEYEQYLEALCDLQFLGVEAVDGSFAMPQNEMERRVMMQAARRRAEKRDGEERFQVTPPFRAWLEIA